MSKTLTIMLLALVIAGTAAATDVPTDAAIFLRVFNDCPFSILSSNNNYPALIEIEDVKDNCGDAGWANRHAWRFSLDGSTAQLFSNINSFSFGADVTISGTGEAEAGIGISPWWSPLVDGVFMLNTVSGEIACFGGRLPFYSFTAEHGITYEKGTTVTVGIEYRPNSLSEEDPGTIKYFLDAYESGYLTFDMGNPDEPYGVHGILDNATAGGWFQLLLQQGDEDAGVMVQWENITFEDLGDAVATESSTLSGVKSLFR
jgi:hypothetical protein